MDGSSRDPNANRDESPCGAGGVHGWKVSADGSVIHVADVNADNLQVAPRGFTEFGGELYFSASDQLGSSSSDEELWKVAADGHVSLVDRNVRISNPFGFTPFTTDVRPNSPPTAADDAATTAEDTAVTAYVLRNDLDTDGDSLSLAITTGPSNSMPPAASAILPTATSTAPTAWRTACRTDTVASTRPCSA